MNASLLKKALPHVIAVVVFLVVAVIYCKPALQGKVLNQSDVIGWKGMAQQSFEYKEKNGHFPLWSESAFSGMPAYTFAMDASTKITTGYLSYLLTFGFPKPVSFFLLACICFYILAQVMRINPWISIMAALGYAYSTFDPVIIAVGHDTQIQAIGFAPAVIASVLLIYQRKYLWGASLLSIFFGFQISTQHLQIAYYTGIILAFITLAYVALCWKRKQLKDAGIGIAVAIVGGAIGFCTLAVSMLPLQEYAKETKRGGKSALTSNGADANKSKGGLDKDYAFQWNYGIPETFTLVVPGIYGGGSEGKLFTTSSKFADKAVEIGMPEDNALQQANYYAYWGTQPNTAGPVYLGAVICFLFILGLVYVKSWHKWWLISAAVLGILLAWGKNLAFFNYFLFDHLPFYNKFRAPTQALFMPQLVVPLFAALGLQEFLYNGNTAAVNWKRLKSATFIAAGLMLVIIVFYFTADFSAAKDSALKSSFAGQIVQSMARGKQPTPEMQQQAQSIGSGLIKGLQADRQYLFGADLLRTMLLMTLTIVVAGLYVKGKIKPEVAIVALILLSSYDLLAEGRIYLNEENFVEPADYEAAFNPTPANVQIARDPDKNFRVFDQASENGWYEDAHASYHHNSLGGYSPAKLGLYQDIMDSQLLKGNFMVYNMLNTKYITRRNPANGQIEASLNPNAFGPVWLVKHLLYVNNGNEEMRALDSINVRDTAILQKSDEAHIPFAPVADTSATITLLKNANDTLLYKSSSKTNQFAVFSEVYYEKGWNVYLDGKQTPYVKVDYVLRGMPIPAGDHSIEFRFEPAMYKLGNTISAWASILAYLILIAAIAAEWKKKNQLPEKNNS